MQSKMFVCLLVFVCLLTQQTQGHQFKLGSCKTSKTVQNFDPERFNGTWYVHKKLATSSECLAITFNWNAETQEFRVAEERIPLFSAVTPLEIEVTNVGKLEPSNENQAKMALKWEGIGMNLVPYTLNVVDTDYDNFALNAECQSLLFAKRVSGSILTRTQDPIPEETMNEYEQILGEQPDIDASLLNTIDQSSCASRNDADFKFQYDNNGVSLMALAGGKDVRNITNEEEAQQYVEAVQQEEEAQE